MQATAWGIATVRCTLRPVEQLHVRAQAVTAADPSQKMPVPAAEDKVRRLAGTLNGMLGRLEGAAGCATPRGGTDVR